MSEKEKVSGEEVEVFYECREIGEGDWTPCDLRRYTYCQKQPEMDTRAFVPLYQHQRITEALRGEVERLKDALEIESHRLAACGVAALGYFDGCAEEYHSASLHDVLALRAQLAQQQGVPEGWRRVLDRVRLTDEEARHYSPSAVAYWNNAVTACRCALDEIAPVQAEPATYKAMLSAATSAANATEFSQFLSAVMDAAGLVRHGRRSKELSEYLGRMCMQYRLSAVGKEPVQAEPASPWVAVSERLPQIKQVLSEKCTLEGREIPTLYRSGMVLTFDGSRVSAGIVEWFHGKSPLNNVTHWMPLPAAPAIAAAQEGGKV